MKNITILNFSGRNNGNCKNISELIKHFYKQNANICVFECSPILEPCNHCNYECLREKEMCPYKNEIEMIMNQAINSNIIYYIIPNYCGFPCANYFAFNERTVGYFNRNEQLLQTYYNIKKKFIIVSNAENDIFYKAMEQQSAAPDILYISSNKYDKRSISGDLMEVNAARDAVYAFLTPIIDL